MSGKELTTNVPQHTISCISCNCDAACIFLSPINQSYQVGQWRSLIWEKTAPCILPCIFHLLLFANKGRKNKLQSPKSSVLYLSFLLQVNACGNKKKGVKNPEVAIRAPKSQNKAKPKKPTNKPNNIWKSYLLWSLFLAYFMKSGFDRGEKKAITFGNKNHP